MTHERDSWRGGHKVMEECAELVVELAKLAAYPDGVHPDGAGGLVERVAKEMEDVRAALDYFQQANPQLVQCGNHIPARRYEKLTQFRRWGMPGFRPLDDPQRESYVRGEMEVDDK